MNDKHVNKPVLRNGLGICTEGICGNDVARQGEAGDRGMVNNAWTDLDCRLSRDRRQGVMDRGSAGTMVGR